jgi:hypothetical protein
MFYTLIMTNFSNVNAISVILIDLPLSNILITFFVPPKSIALHCSVLKISHIVLILEFE